MSRSRWLALFLSGYVFLVVWEMIWLRSSWGFLGDFTTWPLARLLLGGSAYFPVTFPNNSGGIVTPPPSLLVLWLTGGNPIIWLTLTVGAYALSVLLLAKTVRRKGLFILLAVLFVPAWFALYDGGLNTIVLFFLVGCYVLQSDHPITAGLVLSGAIMLKGSPAILLVYFLLTQQWKVMLSALVGCAVLTLITLLAFGPRPLVEYLIVMRSLLGQSMPSANNGSLQAIFANLGLPSVIGSLTLVAIFGSLSVITFRRGASARLFGAWIILMVYLSPMVWAYHGVYLLIPLAIVLDLSVSWGLLAWMLVQANHFAVTATGVPQSAIERGVVVVTTGVAMAIGAGVAGWWLMRREDGIH